MLNFSLNRAQESRAAIQKLQTAMRHLLLRGSYKPLGTSGAAMVQSLLTLNPEIYGSIADSEKIELKGLLYVFQRLPLGIEQSRYVRLIAREGFENSEFEKIIPSKRRRNCYKIDDEQMYIEMTRGRSDIYDVLTHLTFFYIEAEKIRQNGLDSKNQPNRAWKVLEKIVTESDIVNNYSMGVGITYLSTLLGRTFDETMHAYQNFEEARGVNSLFQITYWMGKRSMEEYFENRDREISFSSILRELQGHHIHGEYWAKKIKKTLYDKQLLNKKIHIISANLHSTMNCLFGFEALGKSNKFGSIEELAVQLSQPVNTSMQTKIEKFASENGMITKHDPNRTNISIQIIDLNRLKSFKRFHDFSKVNFENKVIIVMDYAFGEQAYETMDELLKPFEIINSSIKLNIASINIMGKAGILCGKKGDIMIPNAHIFEGSADNYVFDNALNIEEFSSNGLTTYCGPMITVVGTSLQNKDILRYFLKSSWHAIGLEMEGAHYLKAIQAASKIRNSIDPNVTVRNAYYASDNPLKSGSTLASGSLGIDGVKPTYAISMAFLRAILAN